MARIEKVAPENAQGEVEKIYTGIKGSFGGRVPNIFQYMGNSPLLLKGCLDLMGFSNKVSLSPDLREKISLAVGSSNSCNYCVAAHTAASKGLGVAPDEIEKAKKGESGDPKTAAILKFSKAVAEKRGDVSDEEVKTLKAAGVTDKEICELLLVITVSLLTNTFNRVVDTPVDF